MIQMELWLITVTAKKYWIKTIVITNWIILALVSGVRGKKNKLDSALTKQWLIQVWKYLGKLLILSLSRVIQQLKRAFLKRVLGFQM